MRVVAVCWFTTPRNLTSIPAADKNYILTIYRHSPISKQLKNRQVVSLPISTSLLTCSQPALNCMSHIPVRESRKTHTSWVLERYKTVPGLMTKEHVLNVYVSVDPCINHCAVHSIFSFAKLICFSIEHTWLVSAYFSNAIGLKFRLLLRIIKLKQIQFADSLTLLVLSSMYASAHSVPFIY